MPASSGSGSSGVRSRTRSPETGRSTISSSTTWWGVSRGGRARTPATARGGGPGAPAPLRALIADRLGVPLGDVDAVVFGGHGDRAVPVFSRAKVKGKPLRRNAARERDVFEALRGLSARVIAVKGSTTFGPAGCTAAPARALFSDEPSVVPASVVLDGEYGLRGVALGGPVRVGGGGGGR